MDLPEAVMFDLDGTLLDGRGHGTAVERACREVAAQQPGLTAERLAVANQHVWEEYWPGVEHEWTVGGLAGAAVSEEAWRRSLRSCGYGDERLVGVAVEAYARYEKETYRLFEDARHVLARLKDRVPLALVSNGAADTQREKVHVLGIEACFEAVALSGELGVAKPDEAIFQFALDELDVQANRTWHVGDSLETDVAGARAAGVAAVWLNRRSVVRQPGDPEPDEEIPALTNLLFMCREAP